MSEYVDYSFSLPPLMDMNTIAGVSDYSGSSAAPLSGNNDWNNAGMVDNAALLAQSQARALQLSNESMANSINSVNANLAAGPNPSYVDSSQMIADLYPSGLTNLQQASVQIPLDTAKSQAQLQTSLANSKTPFYGDTSGGVYDDALGGAVSGAIGGKDATSTDSSSSVQQLLQEILNNPNNNLSGDSFTQDQVLRYQTNQILNNPNNNLSGDSYDYLPDFPGSAGSTDLIASVSPSLYGSNPYTPQDTSGIMSLRNMDSGSDLSPTENQTLAREMLGSDTYNPVEVAVQKAIENYSPEADLISAQGMEAKGRFTGAYPGASSEKPTVQQKEYSPGVEKLAKGVFYVEAKNDPNAQNPVSSAGGIGQFIDSTWLAQVAKNYPQYGRMDGKNFIPAEGYTKQQILSWKFDPNFSQDLSKSYLTEIGKDLKTDDPGKLYLGYFVGSGGARSLLNADPSTPVSDLLSSSAINSNYSILGGGKTAGQVIASVNNKIQSALDTPRPSADIPNQVSRPQDTKPSWMDNLPDTVGRKVVSSGGDYVTAAGLGALFPPAGAAYGLYTLGAGVGNLLTGSNTFPTVGNAFTNQVMGPPRSVTTAAPANANSYTEALRPTSTEPVPALDAVRTSIAPAGSFTDLYGNVSTTTTTPYTGSFADRGMEIPQPARRPFDVGTDYGYAPVPGQAIPSDYVTSADFTLPPAVAAAPSPSVDMGFKTPADISPLWDTQYDQNGVFTVQGPRVGGRGQTVSPYSGVEPLGPDQVLPTDTDYGYGAVPSPTREFSVPSDYSGEDFSLPPDIPINPDDPNTYAPVDDLVAGLPEVPRGTTIPRPISPAYTAETDRILNSILTTRVAGASYLGGPSGGGAAPPAGGGGGGGGGGADGTTMQASAPSMFDSQPYGIDPQASLIDFSQLSPAQLAAMLQYTQARGAPPPLRDYSGSFTQEYQRAPAPVQYAVYDPRSFGPRRYAEGGIVSLRRYS